MKTKTPQASNLTLNPLLAAPEAWAAIGTVIAQAIKDALARPGAILPGEPVAVREAVNEFLNAKARAQRSDPHLKHLLASLNDFARSHARMTLDQVKPADISGWLSMGGWSITTRRHYLGDLSIFFNWTIKQGYIERNPCKAIELPAVQKFKPPVIHAPEEVRTVLETARHYNQDVCRHLAIRYFAGVRTSEAHLMREEHLKLDQNLIEVPAANAKTRRRRLITIQPNLRAWLDLGGELRPIGLMTVRSTIRLSKVPWGANVTRHSFVSYHVARFENASKTALEAGNSEQMVFAHYRALVTPAAAAEYWSIVPK